MGKVNKVIDKEEENWRAENDAEALIQYQKIRNDKKRYELAKKKLKERKEDILKALK